MEEAYIGIPALTEAQRASELLSRNRLRNVLVRMPALPGKSSCAYGLRLRSGQLALALRTLRERNIRVGRVLVRDGDGSLREQPR